MWLKIISVFAQSIILFDRYYFVIANPMFGENVRLAETDEFLFVVAILKIHEQILILEENFICSGVLITNRDIITAAHCLEGEKADDIVVHAGSNNILQATRYYVLWLITYNEWALFMNIKPRHQTNDIAHIRLSHNVTHHFYAPPLSNLKNEELYGKNIIIAAWGQDEEDNISPLMKTVILKVLTIIDCRNRVMKLHGKIVKIHRRHICSCADPPAVMYFGDSGGPLLYAGKIVGVHKATLPFPDEPRNPKKVNIHTSIDYFRDFIDCVVGPNFSWT